MLWEANTRKWNECDIISQKLLMGRNYLIVQSTTIPEKLTNIKYTTESNPMQNTLTIVKKKEKIIIIL